MIGQMVSHYTILEKLGEGGMGVVYRAHDTTLERDVALKFLPGDVSASEEERSRFIHEAKAASALDHSNICSIYEVGETLDKQLFIAMGYYEGESLTRKIQKGRLKVEEAVNIAMQVAEGLQAAHEKGIVHRDIKSGNILVTPRGQVKILDFGLAHKSGLSKLTRTGTTVGTASYMSPEQAMGDKVDLRCDLWSLGIVLYEMVTGKLPFRGEHEAAILYSVVHEQPQPIEASISDASPELIHIIGRALEKNPAERYKTAEDMLIDLKRLRKETSRTGFAPVGGVRRKASPVRTKIMMIAGAIMLLGAAGYFFLTGNRTDINPEMTFRPLKIPFTDIGWPGISGDGNWIAFGATDHSGKSGLYIMHSSGGDPRQIIPTTGKALLCDVSADGSLIAYNVYDNWTRVNSLYIIHSIGGTPVNIGPGDVGRFRPDGQRLGYIRGSGHDELPSGHVEFWSVAVDGSDPRREFTDTLSTWEGSASVAYSPDGGNIAWIRSLTKEHQEIIIHDLRTGQERMVTSDKKAINEVAWLREEMIAYTTNKGGLPNIWVIPARGGSPVQITKETTTPPSAIRSTADGRKMLYLQSNFVSNLFIVDIENKRSQQIAFGEDFQMQAKFSPDSKHIALMFSNDNLSTSHIAIMDRDGRNRKQLTSGEEIATYPVWSPDGRWIAYNSRKMSEPDDSVRTYLIDVSSPGPPRYISPGEPRYWIDSTQLQIATNNGMFITSVDRAPLRRVYDDSTWAYITEGEKYIVYRDLRHGRDPQQWWIVDGTIPRDQQRKTARTLVKSKWLVLRGTTCYWMAGIGEVWRMVLPDGKPTRIKADLLGVDNSEYFGPSMDGKEIIIGKWRYNSSMVIIENLFKR